MCIRDRLKVADVTWLKYYRYDVKLINPAITPFNDIILLKQNVSILTLDLFLKKIHWSTSKWLQFGLSHIIHMSISWEKFFFYWYQDICPCDLGHFWNRSLSVVFVFYKHILLAIFYDYNMFVTPDTKLHVSFSDHNLSVVVVVNFS